MAIKAFKNILILGGAGFLGANLVRRCLQEKDINITVIDSLDPAFYSSKSSLLDIADKIKFIEGDIRDSNILKQIIPNQEVIFNCAAQTSHPRSLQDAIFDTEINCIGTLKVLTAVKDYNPGAIVVYPSSSTVIGKAKTFIDENHFERPLEIYSANKGVAEKYHQIFCTMHNLKTIVLRFGNLFGPYGKNHPDFGFINYFINQVALGNRIKIFGEGRQKRNPMFVDDATEIMWQAAHNPRLIGEIFFAAHYNHHSVREIAQTIVEVFGGEKPEFIIWPEERKRIEVENVEISSAKLYALTGWKPKYSLMEGLKITKKRMGIK